MKSTFLGLSTFWGTLLDFAVVSPVLDPDTFGNALAVSSASRQFATGIRNMSPE